MRSSNISNILIILLVCLFTEIIIFQKALEGLIFRSGTFGGTSIIDELSVIFLLLISVGIQMLRKKIDTANLALIFVAIYLFVISILFGKNSSVTQVLVQVFLHMQYLIIVTSLLYIQSKVPKFAISLLIFTISVSVIGLVMQLIFPGVFSSVFGIADFAENISEYNQFRLEGLQKNPNAIGMLFGFYLIWLLYSSRIKKLGTLKYFLGFCALIIIIFSGSRSSLLFILLAFFLLPIRSGFVIKSLVVIVCVSVLALGIGGKLIEKSQQNLESVSGDINDSKYIRWIMMYYGAVLAIENFPIGTGAGTFGSAMSHDSVVYSEVGIEKLPSVKEATGIHDSNFGTIAGEFGIVGLFIFFGVGGWILSLKLRRNRSKQESPVYKKCYSNFIILMLGLFVLAPFFRPLFDSSYYSAIFALTIAAFIEAGNTQTL